MTTKLSRRAVLKGITAGAVVVAWDPLQGVWLDEDGVRAAAAGSHERIPHLDGTLTRAPEDLGAFSGDFGRLVTNAPWAVLRPGSVGDIAAMVAYARRNRLEIAMNGQSGPATIKESHSTFGQALVPGGIAIDARGLNQIHHIGPDGADVDAGVTWAELVTAAAPHGLKPALLPDYLGLSIGGLISVGGFGGEVQHVGSAADNVTELLVVTGWGRVVRCSPSQRPGLFHAALAGAGQFAIIVRARVRLVPAPASVRVFRLVYDNAATYVADQLAVMASARFAHQEGFIVRTPDDSGWVFAMELGAYYTSPEEPDNEALLADLSDIRPALTTFDLPFAQWAFRLEPVVEQLAAGGFLAEKKPWISVFVPASQAARYLESIASQLSPADVGAGLAGFFPVRREAIRAPYLMLPDEPAAFQLNLLRFPFPGYPEIDRLVTQNRSFYDEAVALGGKRYIVGSIPMSNSDWRAHYGRSWRLFRNQKNLFDPARVLTPGQGIFR